MANHTFKSVDGTLGIQKSQTKQQGLFDLKPYSKNPARSGEFARAVSEALLDTDVFVLNSDSGGTDMYVELGIAIAQWMDKGKPRVYIVGEHNKRSLMHLHPSVIHLDDIGEVFWREGA